MPPITDEELASEAHRSLLASISLVRQELEAAGPASEEQRRLPDVSVAILQDLGVFWLKTPSSLGGTPLDPLQFSDVIEELAYIEPSAAWAAMIGAGSTGLAARLLPEEEAKDVFLGQASLPVFAGQARPRGTGRRVDGGFVVNGHWNFASGIHHADWLLGSFRVEEGAQGGGAEGGGEQDGGDLTAFVVPKAEAEVIDDWHVAGLQGTGSADFLLREAFIPAGHTRQASEPASPSRARRYGPLFAQDSRLFVSNELPSFCVGATRRAIDDMVEVSGGTRSRTGAALFDRPVFHHALGSAQVRVRAAQLLYRDVIATAWEATRQGEEVAEADRLAVASAQTYVAQTCVEVITSLFRYGPARALTLEHPMQRHLRNLLAARQNLAATEQHYEVAGRERIDRPGGGSTPRR